jgi:hypothetical protein
MQIARNEADSVASLFERALEVKSLSSGNENNNVACFCLNSRLIRTHNGSQPQSAPDGNAAHLNARAAF